MRNTLFLIAVSLLCLTLCGRARGQVGAPQAQLTLPTAPATDATTYQQQYSYMLGQNFGNGLRENQIDCDLQSLIAGITDALRGARPRWSEAELQACRQRFGQEMRQKATTRLQQISQKNAQEAEAFLAANKQKEGVQVTASGLQYKVIRQGTGPSPTLEDSVRCHYRGTLIDGTEFDSSYGRGQPAEFPVKGVITGWTEALQKMKVGDKWQLFIPADLAYGLEPPGPPIQPNSMLIFEIELLGINGQ